MIILETKRLILRTWQNSDLEPFAKMNSDKDVMEFFPSILSKKESDELAAKINKHYGDNGYTLYAISLKETKEFIGFVGLLNVEKSTQYFAPSVEIGWRLTKECWGKGYATEAARAVLAYGFTELKLKEIVSFTAVINKPSQRVMEKIGLTHNKNDDFDHPKLEENSPLLRHVLYRLTREEWKSTTDK